MPLQKQNVNVTFGKGIDTKTDPWQIPLGKFARLQNSVFDKGKQLKKRNGYQPLTALPDTTYSSLSSFNGNLTAVGSSLAAYSSGSETWANKGFIQPVDLSTLPLIRTSTNQSQCDAAVSSRGLVCTVFTDTGSASTTYKYAIADAVTGQNIVAPSTISSCNGSPRVFVLGNYFVIVFKSSTANHLQYVAITITSPTTVTAATDLTTAYLSAGTDNAWEAVVANNRLYVAFNGSDGGGAIRITYIEATLAQGSTVAFAGKSCTSMSVCADLTQSSPVIYMAFYTTVGPAGYVIAVNQALTTVLAATQIIAAGTIANITCAAQNASCTVFYEVTQAYSYDAAVPTNKVTYRTCSQTGTLGTATTLLRSVGLASKAFILNDTIYVLTAYSSSYQPTYFLTSAAGKIVAKLAYSNGGGYLTKGLPHVNVDGDVAQVAYLFKDLVTPVNKNTATPSGTQTAGIYAQLGVNLATFEINNDALVTAEIGNNLHLSGGFLWSYDGYVAVENGFHVYPDNVEVTTNGAGGSITAQDYYYVATYEWSDNQGNLYRSAPSIPVKQTTVGATSTNTINVPTLRLTHKTANPVKIVIYRWSTAQQVYYQVTSISVPTLNDTTADSVAITDTFADATILGNSVLYTTGGVVENISPPAMASITPFKSRLFGVDAEDRNLLWFSKQVIEATPVEMTDLFTIFVGPTVSPQGNTGPITALSAMDDKLIIFKENAIYYIVGNGPDNTGANNDYSDPVFITSTVGCTNQASIVFMPQGLMFQSDKGIWLLDRNLGTSYIGVDVDDYNSATVQSALNIPGTNQVRFTLDTGVTLMYDYFFGEWGTFNNVPSISSTLYQDLDTYVDQYGQVFQEAPGVYLDGSNPVLMSFTLGWINVAGLQGFIRAYFIYLLAKYISPHKLQVQIAYDYNDAPTQTTTITPDNYSGLYGDATLYGGDASYGGNSNVEQWRIFLERQQCEAFQITVNEIFDASIGAVAGAGFTMSGLDLVIGVKRTYPRLNASRSAG